MVKKILEVKYQFSSSKEKLGAERGSVKSVERQNITDSTNHVRGKQKALDFDETSTPRTDQPIKPLVTTTEQCTQTLSWPEDSDMSAVYVSRCIEVLI